jgi:hypothetical protein
MESRGNREAELSLKLWLEHLYLELFERRPEVLTVGDEQVSPTSGLQCLTSTLWNMEMATRSALDVYVPFNDRLPAVADTFNRHESRLAVLGGTLLTRTNGILTAVRLRSRVPSSLVAVASGPTGIMQIRGPDAFLGIDLPGHFVTNEANLVLPAPPDCDDTTCVYPISAERSISLHVQLGNTFHSAYALLADLQSIDSRVSIMSLRLVLAETLPPDSISAPIHLEYHGHDQPGALAPSGATNQTEPSNIRWVTDNRRIGIIRQARDPVEGNTSATIETDTEVSGSLRQRLAQSLTGSSPATSATAISAEPSPIPTGHSLGHDYNQLPAQQPVLPTEADEDSTVAISREEIRRLLATRHAVAPPSKEE